MRGWELATKMMVALTVPLVVLNHATSIGWQKLTTTREPRRIHDLGKLEKSLQSEARALPANT